MHADTRTRKIPPLLIGHAPRTPWQQPSFSTSHHPTPGVTTSQTHIRNDARPRTRPPRPGPLHRRFRKLYRHSSQPLTASRRGEARLKDPGLTSTAEPAQPVQGLQESLWSSVRTHRSLSGREMGEGRRGVQTGSVKRSRRGGIVLGEPAMHRFGRAEDSHTPSLSSHKSKTRSQENARKMESSRSTRNARLTASLQVHHRPQLPRHHRTTAREGVRHLLPRLFLLSLQSTHTTQWCPRWRFRRRRRILRPVLLRRGPQGARRHHDEDSSGPLLQEGGCA
jgi:hypothetical protein